MTEQAKRIAELLGFKVKLLTNSVLIQSDFQVKLEEIIPQSPMAYTPFNINSDFAICRMLNKLFVDGYGVSADGTGVLICCLSSGRDVAEINKPINQGGLAEAFLQVYKGE